MPRIRVFIAASLDGFIAGPNDELDWLDVGRGAEDTFTPFMREIGALLMGRRTYDVAAGFEGDWPYGDTPVLVATHRPLEGAAPSVRAVEAESVDGLLDEAQRAAGDKDVYLDGGALIRAALDAGRIDEITVTVLPIILGAGLPLFAAALARHTLGLESSREIGAGLVQLRYHVGE
ncbi:MAG: dihydrofolate reductase family protein [Myxococcales bacterium]|nr:dihydrofolate reductase family protein [Myxococcales bacterium]